jgi:hypothetical protein
MRSYAATAVAFEAMLSVEVGRRIGLVMARVVNALEREQGQI